MVGIKSLAVSRQRISKARRVAVSIFFFLTVVGTVVGPLFCAEYDTAKNSSVRFAKNLANCVKDFPQNGNFIDQNFSVDESYRDEVLKVYENSGFQPLFLTDGKLNKKGEILLQRINSLTYDGIDIESYSLVTVKQKIARLKTLNNLLEQLRAYILTDPKIFVDRFCPGYFTYVGFKTETIPVSFRESSEDIHTGITSNRCEAFVQVIATANRALLSLNKTAGDLDAMLIARAFKMARDMGVENEEAILKALSGPDDLREYLSLIEPKSVHYEPLRNALKLLLERCNETDDITFNFSSKTLRPGKSCKEVIAIKKKLKIEGYYNGPFDETYDPELVEAVKRFQRANALKVDGIVGKETKEALKRPIKEKIRYVKLALAEYRKKPLRDLKRGIVINIPQFTLEVYNDGKIVERHRVIVGKAGGRKKKLGDRLVGINQTPVLESNITRIVFKPRWYVNKRILKELEAESKGDPDYYVRQGFVFLPPRKPGGTPRVYQKPGVKNALGLVKFEFPNRYQVYLHDTPTKRLFSKSRRDFSHGCIRVQNALALARTLLKLDNNKAVNSIDKYLKRKNPTYVKLNEPFPIYVRYIPASTDEQGNVVILRDIYGRLKDKDKVDNKTLICRIGG